MKIKPIPFISLMLCSSFTATIAGDVITEDTTVPGLPEAVVDGDLIIEDTDDNNSAMPGLYVEGLSDLKGGMVLEGMDIKPLNVFGGAGSQSRKIVYGGQDYSMLDSGGSESLAVLIIDRVTGEVVSHKGYNTWQNEAGRDAMAADLNALTNGDFIVVITSQGPWNLGKYYEIYDDNYSLVSWGNEWTELLLSELYRIGASSVIEQHPTHGLYKSDKNYVLIGIPGLGQGNGIEHYSKNTVAFNNVLQENEISTLLVKADNSSKYVPIGLGHSENFKLDKDRNGIFQGVGIRTSTPSVELDVVGDARISGDLTVTGALNAANNPVSLSTTPNLTSPTGGLSTDGGDSGIYSTTDNTVSIATGGMERFHIDSTGNVDISEDLILGGGITFADGSRMTQAPDKVVYISEGDDITAILSSPEENIWYRIGPGTHTLTADVNARNGCRYSGAGKEITIIDGAAIVVPCLGEAPTCGERITITVESFTAIADLWFTGTGWGDVLIRDCNFTGDDVGGHRKDYWIYDSYFSGNRAFSFSSNSESGSTMYAYNSTFNSSNSLGRYPYFGAFILNAYNCQFLGDYVGGSNTYNSPMTVRAYNCVFDITNSFGGGVPYVDFVAHNSTINTTIIGEDNFISHIGNPIPITLYNCVVDGTQYTTQSQGSAIIDAPAVGIGTDTPATGMKLDVDGNTNISGDLTVSGSVTMEPQGDISMGQFGVGAN